VMLERVMSDEQVQAGETVLTSGGDQIFPKGLPVGTVTRVGNGKDLFLTIRIKPAANLAKLEEVLVLTEKQERQAVAEGPGRVRAADILAQRLPSVPDKPAETPAGTPGSSSGPANATPKPNLPVAGITAGAVKSASGNSAAKPAGITAPPPKTTSQASGVQKPKPVNPASSEQKPESTPKPLIVEQKPASVAPAADTPQPAQDNNSPQ